MTPVGYFLDNTLSPRHADLLTAQGFPAIALQRVFPPDIKDVDFLPRLPGTGWIFVTSAKHIRTRTVEMAALRASGVTAVFLFAKWSNENFGRQADWLQRHWPAIDRFVRGQPVGTIVTVRRDGRMTIRG